MIKNICKDFDESQKQVNKHIDLQEKKDIGQKSNFKDQLQNKSAQDAVKSSVNF